jgi:hypothetical protein
MGLVLFHLDEVPSFHCTAPMIRGFWGCAYLVRMQCLKHRSLCSGQTGAVKDETCTVCVVEAHSHTPMVVEGDDSMGKHIAHPLSRA